MRRGLIAVLSAIFLLGTGRNCWPAPVKDSSAPAKDSSAPAKGSSKLAPAPVKILPRSAARKRKASAPGVKPQIPLMVNGRLTVTPPPTEQDMARAQEEVAKAFQYKGTTAVPYQKLDPDDAWVKSACKMLSEADFIPEARIRSFSGLRPRFTIVGWRLTVHQVEVRPNDTLVRVWASPRLMSEGEGIIGVMAFYGESYRIVGGELEFLDSDPITAKPPIMMGGSQ